MRNIGLLFYFIGFFLSESHSQTIQWQKTFGGSRNEVGNDILGLSNGNLIIFGSAGSSNGDVIGNHFSPDLDAWLLELDTNQYIISQKCFGGISGEEARSGLQLTTGKIFMGTADFNDGDVSGVHNSQDIWVVRTDNLNHILWQHCYGTTAMDYPYKILSTSDGGFIFLGQYAFGGGDVTCFIGEEDLWLVKIDSVGTIEWQSCLGSTMGDGGGSIIASQNGGYYVYGGAGAHDGNVNCSGSGTVWLVKLNSLGSIEWSKCYPSQHGVDLVQSNSGNLFLVAITSSSSLPGYSGGTDYWVYKTDSLGNIFNSYCYGGSWLDEPSSISLCADGGVIVSGTTWSNDSLASGNHGSADAFIVKLDSSCNREWSRCYGGTLDDKANSIIQTLDGGFIFTGSTKSNDGDITSTPHGGSDLWVVKIAPTTLSTLELQNPISQLSSYFENGKINISFTSTTNGDYLIVLYDQIGRELFSEKLKSNVGVNHYSLDTKISSGIKILRIQNSNSSTTIKVFVN